MASRSSTYEGYIRVSRTGGREGESFISPAVQKQKIEDFAKRKGHAVVCCPPELDSTGSKLARPILDGIVANIKEGRSEGIIVAAADRLSRAGIGDAIRLVEEIQAAGGKVCLADFDIDPSTPTGEMALTMWLGIARMQWRQYQESWLTAKERAVGRGVFPAPAPLGYDKGPDGKLAKNADAEDVGRAFYISAYMGLPATMAFLRDRFPTGPVRKRKGSDEKTAGPRTWNSTIARAFLANRIYIGELRHGDFVRHDPTLAIVDRDMFDMAQHAGKSYRPADPNYPLTGIATCAACGGGLVGQTIGKRRMRCNNPACTKRVHLNADPLEELVLQAIQRAPEPKTPEMPDFAALRAAITDASAELDRWVEDPQLHARLGAEVWKRGLDARIAALEAAQLARDQASEATDLPPTNDRELFERRVKRAAVKRGRGPLAERVDIVIG